jgi:hydroxymethylpyrimidine/phosphomethylpyrimidine kinase
MEIAAQKIQSLGAQNVLLKGGHLANEATDILFAEKMPTLFPSPRLTSKHTHGTGCALSSAIAANLSRGLSLEKSVLSAKDYITTAIENGIELGKGIGPVNHFYELYRRADVLGE